ncbi:Protein of unknown function [Desulfatibacillum alkenivorans DSM 16219]|uniref:DUF3450 domain-containing protein n=1 Tax=Desulfatibacillum alkenivorans DSM 16219 TaxID=1121393 RepID=A0A1M6FV02_9BACT|nr:DUF3450 domain-containing protein [Desulfatibacillum alkenivorans]SHJ01493.1 Protein of unknown function [Desulfatibacillum alkenivorans DSM 16219]
MKKILFIIICLLASPGAGTAEKFPDSALQPVEESVSIRRETQIRQEEWDAEQRLLADDLLRLKEQAQFLDARQKGLQDRLNSLTQEVAELEIEKQEIAQMASRLEPSLENAFSELKKLQEQSLPFDKENRETRMAALEEALSDPEIGVEEKFRRVFHMLLTEAQYGGAVEVERRLINVKGKEIMADVLRLGRLSLFYQTLDQTSSGYFDPVDMAWTAYPQTFDSGVAHAVDIASKRRPADIVMLPLGKVAAQ